MIINFLSNRNNLSMFQVLMYVVIAYIMHAREFSFMEIGIVFISVFILQFITRVKAVADGMMFRQLMTDYKMDANSIVTKIREQMEKDRKNNNIN